MPPASPIRLPEGKLWTIKWLFMQ